MSKKAISFHRKLKGKISIESKIPKITDENLQLIYTPGVATVCMEIFNNPDLKYDLTTAFFPLHSISIKYNKSIRHILYTDFSLNFILFIKT